jgi:hypothetical protein
MNERDKELAKQATEYYTNGQERSFDKAKFADLIRADEREACAKVCEQPIDEIQITDTISEVVYMDAHECAAGIRARGNT